MGEGVRHKQENTVAHVCKKDMGNGTLFITESCVSWVGEGGQGFSLEYPAVSLHAVSRDLTAFPHQCLYLMVDGDLGGDEDQNSGSDDDDDEGKIAEVRFIPQDSHALDTMFSTMSDCQALHPDPEQEPLTDEEEGNEAWEAVEEGAGDNYYTTEEGLEHLTPEGRATLQHLENIMRNPGDGNQ